ncbi:MAG: hypothetical protein ABWZ75_01660 [Novosphingobium sp.]
MKRFAPVLLFAALVSAPAAQAQPEGGPPPPPGEEGPRAPSRGGANPSAVIAAEVAFSQLAQEKGQWTAFLATLAPGAEMFVPQRVNAEEWLKKRPNPKTSVKWQPHEVWSSCDGSYAVTRGAWQGTPGKFGYFTTLWQRQPKKGDYKWLLDQGNDMAVEISAPEMIDGLVADCRPRQAEQADGPGATPATPPPGGRPRGVGSRPPVLALTPADNPAIPNVQPIAISLQGDRKDGRSRDGTLDWSSVVAPDGARIFVVRMWKGGEMREVLRSVVNAEKPAN